jgi:hypothetical protein
MGREPEIGALSMTRAYCRRQHEEALSPSGFVNLSEEHPTDPE